MPSPQRWASASTPVSSAVVMSLSARPELLDGDQPEDGGQGQPQHLAAAGGAQGDGRGIRIVLVPGDRRRGLLEQRLERAGAQLVVVLEPGDRLGDALEQLADEARAGQHVR